MKQLVIVFAVLAALVQPSVNARVKPDSTLDQRIDAIAQEALSHPAAGLSIAVARHGRLIFARGYGLANVEESIAVTPETVFHIASISKYIESAVLLQLVERGKLSLDDDIRKYIPEAPTHGRFVTIRQLLNHTSGIFSFTSLPNADANELLDLNHDQVLALFRDHQPYFEPGSAWRYNNSGFYLAGMVIERVTGQDYGSYIREHLFKPLRMTARLCDSHVTVPRLATGYQTNENRLAKAPAITWTLPFAAGAVCATATDLVKWQAALDSGKIISSSSLSIMRSPTILSDGTSIDYGLGTRFGSLDEHRVLGHTGGGGGFTTVLESFPQDELTVVVLINTDNVRATSIAAAIARAVLRLTAKPLLDLAVPPSELESIPGTYESDEGMVHLFVQDGKIKFRFTETGEGRSLRRQAANDYAIDQNTEVRFLPRIGRAKWGVVYSGGLMSDATKRVQ